MNNIVIIWSRFGPYHLARLDAAGEHLAVLGWRVIGVEVASFDLYAWDYAPGNRCFERVTLFKDARYEALRWSTIVRFTWQALSRIQPTAIAVNGWATAEAWTAWAWARMHGAKLIVMSETLSKDSVRTLGRELVKRFYLAQADSAIVGGRPHRDYLVSLGMVSKHISLGYDVVDNRHFTSGARQAREQEVVLRAKLHLPEQYFFVNCRFIARKNLHGLLQAYARYRGLVERPWALVISGSGEEEPKLKRLVADVMLKDVLWPGFLQYPDLPAYYGLANAFIHPAFSEPWGLVVNEAAACGLPLLVSETVGAASELLQHGWNGFKFDPYDLAEMAHSMAEISRMPSQSRQTMGRHSLLRAEEWGPVRFAHALAEAAGIGGTCLPK